MDDNDWRSQLLLGSRPRIVDKIFDTLKRHVSISHPEDLIKLKEIATRFEETAYTAATSQSDYLRKISIKMLSVEATYRSNTMTNSLPSNSASGNGNPSNAGSLPNLDDDWRTQVPPGYRARIVDKIFDTLKRHVPFAHPEGLIRLKDIATRFERIVYSVAPSQSDYLWKISLKLLSLANHRSNTVTNSLPSNSAIGNGNPSDAALPPAKKRKLNQSSLESVKKRLPVVEFGNFLEKSGLHGDDDELVCAVCLGSFKNRDKVRELCNCSHVFHRACLDKWINRGHLTCPYCRSDL